MNGQIKPRILLLSTNSDEAGAPLHVETLVRLLRDKVDFTLIFGEEGPVFHRLRPMVSMSACWPECAVPSARCGISA